MPVQHPGHRGLDGAPTGAINPAYGADYAYPQPGPSPAPPQSSGGARIAPQSSGRQAAPPPGRDGFALMLAQRQANGGGSVPIRQSAPPSPPDVCFPDGRCIPYVYAAMLGLVPQ